MLKNVVISVVIPTFNNQKYISESIASAIVSCNEFYSKYGVSAEIIVVDDGSDSPVKKINDSLFQSQDDDIHLISLPTNRGQEYATNIGVEASRGDYCLILHGDDLLEPDALCSLYEPFQRYDSIVMSVGERYEINDNGEDLYVLPPFYDDDYYIKGEKQAEVFLYSGFLPCQVLFRRSTFLKVGGVEAGYHINLDGLLWFKIVLEGDIVYQISKVCKYRRHEDSTTSQANKSFMHIFEWYATTKRMLNYSSECYVCLGDQHDSLVERISDLSFRYGNMNKNINEVDGGVDEGIIDSFTLLGIAASIDSMHSEKKFTIDDVSALLEERLSCSAQQRKISYAPPSGSVSLSDMNPRF